MTWKIKTPDWERISPWLVGLLVIVGLAVRIPAIIQFPLNVDESLNAIRIFTDQFSAWRPTNGVGPAMYYLSGWLSMSVLGMTELGARFFPLMLGLASIPLAYACGRRLKDRATGLTAAFLFCFSFTLAGYSVLWRQYIYQIFASIALLYLALRAGDKETEFSNGRWVITGLALIGLMLISHPAVFTAAGLILVIGRRALGAGLKPDKKLAGVFILLALAGAACFLFTYLVTIRASLANTTILETDHYKMFLVKNLTPLETATTALEQVLTMLRQALAFTGQEETSNIFLGLCTFLFAIGLASLTSPAGTTFWIVGGVTVASLAAAVGLSLYALMWRQLLFLSPFYLLLIAAGLTSLGRWMIQRRYWPALILLIAIMALPALRVIHRTPFIYSNEGTKFVSAILDRELADGDTVIIAPESEFQFYFGRYDDLKTIIDRFGLKGQTIPYNGPADLMGRKVHLISADRTVLKTGLPKPAQRVWLIGLHHSAIKTKRLPSRWRTVKSWSLPDPSQACLRLLTQKE